MTQEELNKLTPEEKRVKIAEYCGWRLCRPWEADPERRLFAYPNRLPDYLNDLNAMQEPWECLGWEEKNECIEFLKDIVEEADCESYFATAAQRADAFLLTL